MEILAFYSRWKRLGRQTKVIICWLCGELNPVATTPGDRPPDVVAGATSAATGQRSNQLSYSHQKREVLGETLDSIENQSYSMRISEYRSSIGRKKSNRITNVERVGL
jgi:hypothetical protein